jgi:hypothetical protein
MLNTKSKTCLKLDKHTKGDYTFTLPQFTKVAIYEDLTVRMCPFLCLNLAKTIGYVTVKVWGLIYAAKNSRQTQKLICQKVQKSSRPTVNSSGILAITSYPELRLRQFIYETLREFRELQLCSYTLFPIRPQNASKRTNSTDSGFTFPDFVLVHCVLGVLGKTHPKISGKTAQLIFHPKKHRIHN